MLLTQSKDMAERSPWAKGVSCEDGRTYEGQWALASELSLFALYVFVYMWARPVGSNMAWVWLRLPRLSSSKSHDVSIQSLSMQGTGRKSYWKDGKLHPYKSAKQIRQSSSTTCIPIEISWKGSLEAAWGVIDFRFVNWVNTNWALHHKASLSQPWHPTIDGPAWRLLLASWA